MVKGATILGVDLYECSVMPDGTIGIGYTIDTLELFTFNKNAKMRKVSKKGAQQDQQDQLRDDQENGQLDNNAETETAVVNGVPVIRKRRKVPTINEVREMVRLMSFTDRGKVSVDITDDLAKDIDAEVEKEENLLKLQQEKADKLRALRGGKA